MERARITELYDRYGYAIHRRCSRLLGSEVEADDALQEVFVRVMRYGAGFTGEAPLAWLYRIADRHCFDRLRARRHMSVPEEAERIVAALELAQGGGLSRENIHTVAQALAACREAVQEVAVLYYVDEMTQDEVASVVGVSRKTVRERLATFVETARQVFRSPDRRGLS